MKLYYLNVQELSENEGLHLLSPSRQERVLRYVKREDRLRSLAAGHLLRYALGERQHDVRILDTGKPYLEGGPYFNLSHSGEYAVLAVSDNPVGVDVEKITSRTEKLAQRVCTQDELTWLSAHTSESTFIQLWTAKESVAKLIGTGLHMQPNTYSVLPICDGAHTVHGTTVYLTWRTIPHYHVCVASNFEQPLEQFFLTHDDLFKNT